MNSLPQFLELLTKSALVLTAAALLAAAWHRSSAAQRHTLWLAAFVALLLLPLSKLTTPHWRLPGSPNAPSIITTTAPVIADATIETVTVIPAPASVRGWRWPDTTRLLTGLWVIGVAALLAYRLIGSVQIARLRRRSAPLDDTRVLGLARTAAAELELADRYEVRHATAARVPCTWGVRRPVILLPTAALQWSDSCLLAALRHEFGHIARRDYLTRWLGYIICALYWPNPLVWLAARSLHKTQEQACDDLVLRAGTPASDYAALLFETANASGPRVRYAVAMARPSTLEGRVLAIVDDTRNRRPSGRGTTVAGALVVVAAFGISALAQVASDTPAPAPSAPDLKPQVEVAAKFVEVRENKWPESKTGAVIVRDAEQATELLRNMQSDTRTEIVSTPRVIANSGQRAQIQIGKDEKLSDNAAKPTFIGTSLEVVPTVTGDGIQLEVNVKLTSARSGGYIVHERDSKASFTLAPGQTLVMAGGQGEASDREVVIFLEARQIALKGAARADAPKAALQPSPAIFHYTDPASMILPKLDFREATLTEGLEFLRKRSRELDPEKRGLNLVLIRKPDAPEPRITISLQEIPLSEALKYIAALADLEVAYEPHAVIFRPVAPPLTQANIDKALFGPEPLTLQSKDGSIVKVGEGTLAAAGQPIAGAITVDPAASAASGRKNTTSPKPAAKPNVNAIPIDIEAKEVRFENGVAVATGDVTLKHGNHTLTTNKLTYDPVTKAIRTQGPSKTIIGDAPIPGLPAAGGAPSANIVTREYQISPSLAASFESEMERRPLKEYLIERGIPFGEGAAATYVKQSRRLVVRNTPESLTAVEALVAAGTPPGIEEAKPAPEAPVPGLDAPRSRLEAKASAIVIPRFALKEATLQQSIDALVEKSREADPEKKGITVTLAKELTTPGAVVGGLDAGTGAGFSPSDVRITISLTNIPVFEALKYITSLAGTKFKITESAFIIAPIQTEAASGLRP